MKHRRLILLILSAFIFVGVEALDIAPAVYAGNQCAGVETLLISCNSTDGKGAIGELLTMAFHIFSGGVFAVAAIGIIVCGVIWMTAQDSQERVAKAKKRMLQVSAGLATYLLLFFVIEFFLPGGMESVDSAADTVSESTAAASDTASSDNTDSAAQDDSYISWYRGENGSVGPMYGRVVIVSIFLSDKARSWDFSSADIQAKVAHIKDSLRTATNWLEGRSNIDYKTEGRPDLEFIWDFDAYPRLKRMAYADSYLANAALQAYTSRILRTCTQTLANYNLVTCEAELEDRETLLRDFRADSVLYMIHGLNDNTYGTQVWTGQKYETDTGKLGLVPTSYAYINPTTDLYGNESVVMTTYAMGEETPASIYAHEIMHTFGAVDLYTNGGSGGMNRNGKITTAYSALCDSGQLTDIMCKAIDAKSLDKSYFSDLDAYYVGLTDSSPTAESYGLGGSQHVQAGYLPHN